MIKKTLNENYFVLLGINPRNPNLSQQTIQNAINEKKAEWSRLISNPIKGERARQYLDAVANIISVLQDEESRKAEADDYISSRYGGLEKDIKAIRARSTSIHKSQIETLSKKHGISFDEIIDYLPKDMSVIDDALPERFNSQKLKDMREQLGIVSRSSGVKLYTVYDFLKMEFGNVTPKTKSLEIIELADKLYSVCSKNNNKTADINAKMSLAATIKTVFMVDKERKLYDEAIRFETLLDIDISIFIVRKVLKAHDVSMLIKMIVERGFSEDDARNYIKNYCVENGYSYEIENVNNQAKENVASEDATAKKNTAKAEDIETKKCAKCGFEVKAKHMPKKCPNCGGDLSITKEAEEACDKVKQYISTFDFLPAIEALKSLKEHGHPEYTIWQKKFDTLVDELNKVKAKIAEHVGKKEYFTAENLINSACLSYPKDIELKEHSVIIKKKVSEATQLLVSLNNVDKENKTLRIELATKILEITNDCDDAKIIISSVPPAPPTDVVVKSGENGNIISWKRPANIAGTEYVVVRNKISMPLSNSDGEKVFKTLNDSCYDEKIENATAYFYGVFAVRGSVESVICVSKTPVKTCFALQKFNAVSKDSVVELNWNLPSGIVSRVEVWRKEGQAPSKVGDGMQLKLNKNNVYIDNEVVNGKKYCYLAVVVYEDKNGVKRSEPKICYAMPNKPLEKALNISAKGLTKGEFELSWAHVARGNIVICEVNKDNNIKSGDIVSVEEFKTKFVDMPTTFTSDNKALVTLKDGETKVVCVLVTDGFQYVASETVILASLDECERLKSDASGDNLVLTIDFPEKADFVVVAVGENADVNIKQNVYNTRITKKQFALSNLINIEGLKKKKYFARVYAGYVVNGEEVLSCGRLFKLSAVLETVDYTINIKKKAFSTEAKATIKIDAHGNEEFDAKSVALVYRRDVMPLSCNDGKVVTDFEIVKGKKARYELMCEIKDYENSFKYRLYFVDEDDYKKFLLNEIRV